MTNKTLNDLFVHLGVSKANADKWAQPMADAMLKYDVTTPARISAFLGNILHECNYFKQLVEGLNYSAEGLAKTWPSRYSSTGKSGGSPNSLAKSIARQPEKIANNCYANRMGNGSEASGDGWKYRGRGPIQRTGKSGYVRSQNRTGLKLVENPDLLFNPVEGSIVTVDYWADNNLNSIIDKGNFDGTADLINIGKLTAKVGDSIGYKDRLAIYNKSLAWFKSNKFEMNPTPVEVPLTGTGISVKDIPLEGEGSLEI